tara:strand:- start:134 stop:670 length:537 start_codon:yes stop_codon:yes gene_type:complete
MTRPVDHRDVILQSLKDYGRQLERALLNLGQIEARWMPTLESNHILWILWHMGRMEDMWAWYLRGGGESAWIEGGWSESIGIDASRNGAGDTIEQVRDFPEISVEKIYEYWKASRHLLISAVESVGINQFKIQRPEIWTHAPDKAPTLLWVLGRVPVENSQHTGQIAYIRGLYAAKFK